MRDFIDSGKILLSCMDMGYIILYNYGVRLDSIGGLAWCFRDDVSLSRSLAAIAALDGGSRRGRVRKLT